MRTGGYTFQQSLTPEAANVVKQAVSLARRRGHAQVTPLHVASAMLASSAGLLKRACLQSHSHPLQCKALELCFNVALNRLPTSASSPLLGPHSHFPSLSNALVAAFKRAQAHQRRGSIENQQQPILALKVEIEQLVISILDDPSVSRVMREAGFSSSQVKTNVEQAVSLEMICSKTPSGNASQSKDSTKPNLVIGNNTSLVSQIKPITYLSLLPSKTTEKVRNEDVISVVEAMISKKSKNPIIVGECPATAEGVVRGVIDKFDKGDVPGEMKYVQFISVPLFTLRNISREEFEEKLGELRSLVKSCISRGVVLYLGDLKWVSEFWSKFGEQSSSRYYYSPVEHMVMELSRLLCGARESGKLWLMGLASFQTYIKCKSGHPSLETLWDLQPLTIPVGSLALSLNLESDLHNQFRSKASADGSSWLLGKIGPQKQLTCCADCLANFNREVKSMGSSSAIKTEPITTNTTPGLPSWLQQYKDESGRQADHDQESHKLRDLCNKWNSICKSVHKQPHFLDKAFSFTSSSPCSSASVSSSDKRGSKLDQSLLNWPVIFEPNKSSKDQKFFVSDHKEVEVFEQKLIPYIPDSKPELLSNPNSSPNSASSSEASGQLEDFNGFREHNPESLNILCNALEKKVPWQKEIIPDIASAVLECRSRMRGNSYNRGEQKQNKEETWLFFLGVDSDGKEKIAKELARLVFGSEDDFVAIGLSSFASSTRADSTDHEEVSNKRARDEHGRSYLERLAEAMSENPRRVFFMEDVDQIDYFSEKGIKKAIEYGSFTLPDGEKVAIKDAIIIFSSESFSSMSRACSPSAREKLSEREEKSQENGVHEDDHEEKRKVVSLDLNIATEDEDAHEDKYSFSDMGILDLVDKQVLFKIQVL